MALTPRGHVRGEPAPSGQRCQLGSVTKGCCASLSRAPMSARHEGKRGGPVLHEGKPMHTTRHQCHSKMRSHAPSKPCLIATFLLRFRHTLQMTIAYG